MAYGQIYQSNFYNHFNKLVTVKIYKRDYVSTVSDIRTTEVVINNNYIGDDTPVIGHSARVVFVNEETFDFYDGILSGYEKEYMGEILWNGKLVFVGFLICDLVEQQLLDMALITLQFTNYLRRLEDIYQPSIADAIDEISTLYDLVSEAILETELIYPINSNSTLFHDGMFNGITFTFLNQVYVENDVFYKNLDEYEDAYTVLNMILRSFDMFLYWHDSKWVLERYENILRVGDWVLDDGGSATSLRQEFNKQDGDFTYINTSQVLQYNSGAETLIIKLNERAFSTLVFNNFTAAMTTTAYIFPLANVLSDKTWYINEDCTDLEVGYNFYGISKYFKWQISSMSANYEYKGAHYVFWTQFNTDIPSVLNVNYKMSTSKVSGSLAIYDVVKVRFTIRVNAGDSPNQYVYQDANGDTQLSVAYQEFEIEFNGPDIQDSNLFAVTKNIELDNITASLGNSTRGANAVSFIISFLPTYFKFQSGLDGYRGTNYIGDIAVTLSPDVIDNQIEADINAGFIKTKEIDLDLFDIDNLNYKNGLECIQLVAGWIRTSSWNSDGGSVYYSLVDMLISSKYKKLNRTTKKIVATILIDEYLKTFAIITDDNVLYDGSPIKFVITQYTWDLVSGSYDIVAEEFPDTDIILN